MTPSPSPFSIGQAIGGQIGQVQERQTDLTAIDQILSQAGQSGDQQVIDNAMNQILSRVSPQRQKTALDILQKRRDDISQQIKIDQQRPALEQKAIAERRESEILAKHARGEKLTPEEQAELTPTSLRSIIGQQKQTFEPTEERLEAERVSSLATEIENDFKASESENIRLDRMEKLQEKGELSTPAMVKTLNTLGIPLAVLSNPDSEEYAKLEADFLRDVRNVFPGGRITNFEIQAYLKTVPGLMNSPEGQEAIIRNRRLFNEAKKARYDAYREILNENDGRKPRNMGVLIDDRIRDKMIDIETRFKDGVQNEIEKFQQPIRMIGPDGRTANIPPNLIESAMNDGFKFQ